MKRLRELGIESKIDVLELDVTSDDSLRAAELEVRSTWQKLDGECPLLVSL